MITRVSANKTTKSIKGFKFRTFIVVFKNCIIALKGLSFLFSFFQNTTWKDFYFYFIQTRSIEIRDFTGPGNTCFCRRVYVCTFQPGHFTGWASGGVKLFVSLVSNITWIFYLFLYFILFYIS